MKKTAGVAIAAVVGTAAVMAYSSMKPRTKNELKKDFRKTFSHMDMSRRNSVMFVPI